MSEQKNVTPEFDQQADRIIARYPASKRSAALPLLHFWQETHDYVADEGITWIAAKLELQPIHILELVTFYPMFRREKQGTVHVKVCRTLSCALGGGHTLYERFAKKLKIDGDSHHTQVSTCGKYSLEYVECLAACGTAPVCMIGDDFYEKVDSENAVDELLKKHSA